MKTYLPSILLAAAASLAATSAAAEELVVRVSYADLDITSAADVETLQARLHRSFTLACRDEFAGSVMAFPGEKACVADGVAQATKVVAERRAKALVALAD